MKKRIAVLLLAVMTGLCACGSTQESIQEETTQGSTTKEETTQEEAAEQTTEGTVEETARNAENITLKSSWYEGPSGTIEGTDAGYAFYASYVTADESTDPDLAAALDAIAQQEEEALTERADAYLENPNSTQSWYAGQMTAEVVRADSSVVSLRIDYNGDLDQTYNIDAATGEILTLSDVVEDPDGLSEETGTDVEAAPFLLGSEGIGIFDGDNGTWFSFEDLAGNVNAKYTAVPEDYVIPFDPDEGVQADLDGDGDLEPLALSFTADENDYVTGGSISIDGKSMALPFPETDFYGFFYDSNLETSLVHTGNGVLLLIDGGLDNDEHRTYLFSVTDSQVSYEGVIDATCGTEQYGNDVLFTDPSCVRFTRRSQFLGTAQVTQEYDLTSDAVTTPFTNYAVYVSSTDPVTNMVEVTGEAVELATGGSIEKTGGSVTIPAGTTLSRLYTDDESWVILQEEDGTLVQVSIEVSEDGWPITYDGQDVTEVFDGIYFAG